MGVVSRNTRRTSRTPATRSRTLALRVWLSFHGTLLKARAAEFAQHGESKASAAAEARCEAAGGRTTYVTRPLSSTAVARIAIAVSRVRAACEACEANEGHEGQRARH